ncbi:MAG: hypothetical protein R6W95_15250 [Desulfosarcina sp.]
MNQPNKKLRVYQEKPKTRQTTHWDIDYMTTEAVEDLYFGQPPPTAEPAAPPKPKQSGNRLALILIGAGVILLGLSLVVASRL